MLQGPRCTTMHHLTMAFKLPLKSQALDQIAFVGSGADKSVG